MNPALWEGVAFVVCSLDGYRVHRVRRIKGGWFWVESTPPRKHESVFEGARRLAEEEMALLRKVARERRGRHVPLPHDRHVTPLVPH
jgi:hypothetical protein